MSSVGPPSGYIDGLVVMLEAAVRPRRPERRCLAETSPADVAHVYAGGITSSIVDGLHGLGLKAHANDAANSDEIKRARGVALGTVGESAGR